VPFSPKPQVVQVPASNMNLQRQFPGHYATLANASTSPSVRSDVQRTVTTLMRVAKGLPVKDHELAKLDDNTKRMGGLLIATLGTLGLQQRIWVSAKPWAF